VATKNRFIISGTLLAAAAVFAKLTADFASNNSHLSSVVFTYVFLIATLILVVMALFLALSPNYLPGGLRNIPSLLPICKEKMVSVWSICARCIGFPLGVMVSALLSALVFYFGIWAELLMRINFWILVGLALLLNTPTAVHGYFRRIKTTTAFEKPTPRFSMGFLSGLGFFLTFLACLKLMGFRISP
jgi:uncharacterized membrane protein